MTKDEALDLALEALEALGASCLIVRDDMLADKIQQAITALREELAQPEQPTEKEKISHEMTAEIVAMRAQLAQPEPEQEPVAHWAPLPKRRD